MNLCARISIAAVEFAVLGLSLLSGPASAQELTSLKGRISDQIGAAIPTASIRLTSTTDSYDRTVTVDQRGNYTFSDVPPGTYRLLVQAQGFEEFQDGNVHVAANQPTTEDIQLKLEQVRESVVVTGRQGDECLEPQGRVLSDVGPGLRAVRRGSSGHYYALTAPGPAIAIYDSDGEKLGQVPAATPSLSSPGSAIVNGSDFEVDSDGNVYVSDFGANSIKIYSEDGNLARTIRVPEPISVEPLPGGEIAVASLTSKHLVDVYDQERGELYRSFGDLSEPARIQCDTRTLICSPAAPPKGMLPAADTDHFWFNGDSDGNVYVSLLNPADPTIRKYDAYGALAYDSTFLLTPSMRQSFPSSNSGWKLNANLMVPGVGMIDLTNIGLSPYSKGPSSDGAPGALLLQTSGASGMDGGGMPGGGMGGGMPGGAMDAGVGGGMPGGMGGGMPGGGMGGGMPGGGGGMARGGMAGGEAGMGGGGMKGGGPGGGMGGGMGMNEIQVGLRITDQGARPIVSKPKVEAIGVDPANQEIWAAIAGNLVHFDQEGRIVDYYYMRTAGQVPVKTSTILVQPDRILVGSDPYGIFVYPRPDKLLPSTRTSH